MEGQRGPTRSSVGELLHLVHKLFVNFGGAQFDK